MNTTHNLVCYDAECALCVRWANRFDTLLAKHGFTLIPLQSETVRTLLRLPTPELMTEMRVITGTGAVFGGADALAHVAGVIWKPLFWLTRIPGVMPLLRRAYRLLARNRGCAGDACALPPTNFGWVVNVADSLPLLIFGIAAAVSGKYGPPWLYMWSLAFALFLGSKWFCFRREPKRTRANAALKIGFLFGWIGMDSAAFFGERASKPATREFLHAALKILLGAILIWVAAPRWLALNPLLAGWTGMVGLVLLLHFGAFHLLSLAWRAAGINATPLMRAPLLARSLGEFWGERWNTAFNLLARKFLFRPICRNAGVAVATMIVFLASGIVHDLVISVPARGGYGLPTLYFLLQGTGVLFERTRLARRAGLGRGFRGWLFMLTVTAGPVFWLFHPPFIRNVILPFLRVIGAS